MNEKAKAKRGVAYLALGEAHYREALQSVRSLKRHMPDLPAALFTDRQDADPVFDRVVAMKPDAYDRSCNIRAMQQSPFEQTLFLDTDTYIAGDLEPAFALLERFDFAAAVSPQRMPVFRREGAPESFPQYNGGVILFRKSAASRDFLEKWAAMYGEDLAAGPDALFPKGARRKKFVHNQPSLRQSLFEDEALRFATLPPEYNCRLAWPGVLSRPVKILHGTQPNLPGLARKLNAVRGHRLHVMCKSRLVIRPYPFLERVKQWFGRGGGGLPDGGKAE
jgi:hypothetical protein